MSDYWEDRAAWDMYNHMKDADETADLIAKTYRNASMQITFAAEDIFERYMTKHKISEREAWELIKTMQDRDSIQELILKLKNKDPDKTRQELIRELEAPAYRFRIERLQELLKQIDTIMENVYQQEQQFDTSFFQNLAEDTYYRKIYNVQRQTGLGFDFSRIDQKQIEQALKMNWSGSHYSARIWHNTGKLAETLKQEMLVSLLTGRTEKDTAAVITNRCGSGAMQARRLVRTESCFVSGELDARAYKECGVSFYRFLAVLDLRTSEICQSLDNKVFSLSERQVGKNYPPMHPWCRSTTLSSASEEDLKNMKRRAYDPETGRTVLIPATMSYADWYQKYVEGDPKAEAQKKMIKNASADRKQFAQYQKVLGKDAPKRFADFQAMKYNEPEEWKILKKKKATFSEIAEKEWSDEFKDKARGLYKNFESKGFTLSSHALSRFPRLNKKGFPELSEDDVLKVLQEKPKYLEGGSKAVFFDKERQISIVQNRGTEDIVSIVRRKNRKEEWKDV